MEQKKVTAFGETKTIVNWSNDPRCVVPYQALRVRLDKGWEPERAIAQPMGVRARRKPAEEALHSAFGESKTLGNWALDSRCVVTVTTLRKRLGRGWSLEEALETPRAHPGVAPGNP